MAQSGEQIGLLEVGYGQVSSMIYLDNAATSFPKPDSVYAAMDRFARTELGNPGRGSHRLALGSDRIMHDARHLLNQFFHGESDDRFIFTLNCTDALNIAIKGVLQPGDHVITSTLEHNSVSRPLQRLKNNGLIELVKVQPDAAGVISPDDVRGAITSRTRMVVLAHASNVLGTVQPIAAVGKIAREHDLLFLVDAAQTAGVIPIDIQAAQVDLLAFPGHKGLLGPTGTGGLYVGSRAQVRAWREGGTGGDSKQPIQPSELPHALEGGTPNVHGIVGLMEGLRYIQDQGLDAIRDHELKLVEQLVSWVTDDKLCRVAGRFQPENHVGTISLVNPNWETQEVAITLDQAFDICVRPGLHCAPYAHQELGTFPDGTIRVSPGRFNSSQDIAAVCSALREIISAA
jgi:cysteine desulfurase family protein